MKLYKLTNEKDWTHGDCQWGENITHETSGEGNLCGPGYTHWYTDPLLAILLNPIHGDFDLASAHLWEGEGEVVQNDHGLKVGCAKATTLRRIELPHITPTQKVRFAILCAKVVVTDPEWNRWADNWLSGKDRMAQEAAWAAEVAARAAEAAEAAWAARAAEAVWAARAAWAAEVAAWAAQEAAEAAWAAQEAGEVSARAAEAARAAASTDSPLDLICLAHRAIEVADCC